MNENIFKRTSLNRWLRCLVRGCQDTVVMETEIKSLKQQIYDEGWRHMNTESELRRDLKTALDQRDSWIALAKKKGYFNTALDTPL